METCGDLAAQDRHSFGSSLRRCLDRHLTAHAAAQGSFNRLEERREEDAVVALIDSWRRFRPTTLAVPVQAFSEAIHAIQLLVALRSGSVGRLVRVRKVRLLAPTCVNTAIDRQGFL